MNETFHDEVVTEHKKRWTRATRRLSVGIAIATVLLLLYSILLFIPIDAASNVGADISGRNLLLYIIYVVVGLALAYLCIVNYLRGLSRFATCFEGGGKRSLFLIRWGFIISIAGVILQLFVFFVIKALPSTFIRLLVGNILLVAGAVIGIMGFLSLATSKGMTDQGRKGALHMSWTIIVILAGALLLSYALSQGSFLKIFCTIINVIGAVLFFRHWKQIIAWPETTTPESEQPQSPISSSNTPLTPNQQ